MEATAGRKGESQGMMKAGTPGKSLLQKVTKPERLGLDRVRETITALLTRIRVAWTRALLEERAKLHKFEAYFHHRFNTTC